MSQKPFAMPPRLLGDGLFASVISFGAMGMSEFYGTPPANETSLMVLNRALELGVSLFDTADIYGRGHNEQLIGTFIARHPREHADGRLRIATKFGIKRDPSDPYKRTIDNSPAYIRSACDASLTRLGVETIDLYYAHRINPEDDIEETMGTLADLKQQGKIRHIGLCEASAKTLEKAHAIHPVAALQSEYSLWTHAVESSILPTSRRLGIGFVAYSPLGRGFLTGHYSSTEDLEAGDLRLSNPRFQGTNLQKNTELLDTLHRIARQHECTSAQAALAWLISRDDRLVAIPGTRNLDRLEENCRSTQVTLTQEDTALLDRVFSSDSVHGERYTPEGMKGTET